MKKLLIALITFVFIVSLSGCAVSPQENKSPSSVEKSQANDEAIALQDTGTSQENIPMPQPCPPPTPIQEPKEKEPVHTPAETTHESEVAD